MRLSTLVFLVVFVGLFGHVRRQADCRSEAKCEVRRGEEAEKVRISNRTTQKLDREISQVDKHLRSTDGSIRSLEQTLHTLQDLVRKAEKDLCRCKSELCETIHEARKGNISRMKEELEQVVQGHRKLLAMREELSARRHGLKAKMELAQAGLFEDDEAGSVIDRLSPVEALANIPTLR